jgi:hypothetical protein
MNVYNECHEQGSFPEGFSDGIVNTMYEKKYRTDPSEGIIDPSHSSTEITRSS